MKSIAIAIITASCSLPVLAQTPVLLKDINTNGSSNTQYYTEYDNKTYFAAQDGINGVELWVTDGTTAGTTLFKDLNPGSGSSDVYLENFVLNGKLLFSASNGTTSGREPWISDGSSAGTQMLKDINPGAGNSYPSFLARRNGHTRELATLGGKAFFFANDGVNGTELWITDGTATGTQLLKDINAGSGSGFNGDLAAVGVILNGKLYFSAITESSGTELWVTDGTSAGTTLFKDINPGAAGSSPTQLTPFRGKFIFSAADNTSGNELWISDGTTTGTSLLKDVNTGLANSNPTWFEELGNKMLFTANTLAQGKEVWITDGTSLGTQIIKDLNPGNATGIFGKIYTWGSYTYFLGVSSNGRSLYKTDGTETGTTVVRNFDTDLNTYTWYSPLIYNNELYFQMRRTAEGWHLWKTDGTEAGTKMVAPDIAPNFNPLENSAEMGVSNGAFFYSANYINIGDELYMIQYETTGLEQTTGKKETVHIYPNPADQYINIEGLKKGTTLTIYNTIGQIKYQMQSQYPKARIDLSGLASGIYLLQVRDQDGAQHITKFEKK